MSTSLLRLAAAAMPPSKPLLSEAVAAWRPGAAYYSEAADALVDLTRNGRHARFGSAAGSDTNDPIMIDYAGGPSMWVPPTSSGSNYARTPGVAYNGTDRLDLRALVYEPSTLPWHAEAIAFRGSNPVVANLYVNNGQMRLAYHQGSGNIFDAGVKITLPGPVWIRAVVDPVPGTLDYYQSSDGENWQLRLSKVLPTPGPIRTDATEARAGNVSLGTLSSVASRVGRAYILVNGEPYIDFDPADSVEPDESWVSSRTGETWTITRSTSGYKATIVRRPTIMFDGVDDYLNVDHDDVFVMDDSTPLTAVVLMKDYDTRVVGDVISKKNGSGSTFNGWRGLIHSNGQPRAQWSDGTLTFTTTAPPEVIPTGVTAPHAWVFRPGVGIWLYRNGLEVDAELSTLIPGGHAFNPPLRMGAYGGGAAQAPTAMEFYGAAVFRRVLTPEEQMQAAAELGVNV